MRYVLPVVLILLAMAARAISQWHYTGTIEQYPIQMDLTIDDAKVEGSYYYESKGQVLQLTGTLAKTGALSLDETPDGPGGAGDDHVTRTGYGGGKTTGSFSGILSTDGRQFTGSWKSADGKQTLPVSLLAVANYVRTSSHPKVGHHDDFYLDTTIPHFLAGKPLAALEAMLSKEAKDNNDACRDLAKEDDEDHYGNSYDAEIIYYSPTLISVIAHDWMQAGGIHPNPGVAGTVYLLKNGKWREITWPRLLLPGKSHRTALGEYLRKDLRRQQAASPPDDLLKDASIYFTPGSITVIYQRYIVDCYAMGEYYVNVPFSVLRKDLDPHGPLAPFIRLKNWSPEI